MKIPSRLMSLFHESGTVKNCPVLLLSRHLMAECGSEVSYYHNLINIPKHTAKHLLAYSEVLF